MATKKEAGRAAAIKLKDRSVKKFRIEGAAVTYTTILLMVFLPETFHYDP
jgi:hypothetical protein